jgi:glutathione S-transferase
MPIIDSHSAEVRNLKGLHLYHFSLSNCSQKARFCLEEKGLQWTSHAVDLMHNEHLTPEFVAINPKAVVPVLVHDGVVVTESSDITDYLDRHFPNPPLRPSDPVELERMYRWLKIWDETQIWLKTLSHATILKDRAAHVRPQMQKFETLVKNDELVEFMREFTSEQGLSQGRLERATQWIGRVLGELDERLKQHPWLAGDAFSLADLAWSIDIHRFQLTKFPMDKYSAMLEWYRRIEARPGFQRMVLDYEAQFRKSLAAGGSAKSPAA